VSFVEHAENLTRNLHAGSFLTILLVLPKYTSFFFQIENDSSETDNSSSGTSTVIIAENMYSSTMTSYKIIL